MILDRLENAKQYHPMGARIALALDYLSRTDFSKTSDGRYDLDGDHVYAIVRRYRPKPLAEIKWEAHRQYVDVQYVAAGTERMGYAPLCDGFAVWQAYQPDQDYVPCDAKGDLFEVRAGTFVIFAPQDAHAPGLAMDTPEAAGEVCKVVVKCRVGE